jgi:UDP-glucose 4-epimerase
MGLEQTKIGFTGGVDNGRGWKGDVKNMLLDVKKVMSLGWKPRLDSLQAVRLTATELCHKMINEGKAVHQSARQVR